MQNIAIIYHDGHAYRVNFALMSRNDAFNLMKKLVIIDKKSIIKQKKITCLCIV